MEKQKKKMLHAVKKSIVVSSCIRSLSIYQFFLSVINLLFVPHFDNDSVGLFWSFFSRPLVEGLSISWSELHGETVKLRGSLHGSLRDASLDDASLLWEHGVRSRCVICFFLRYRSLSWSVLYKSRLNYLWHWLFFTVVTATAWVLLYIQGNTFFHINPV